MKIIIASMFMFSSITWGQITGEFNSYNHIVAKQVGVGTIEASYGGIGVLVTSNSPSGGFKASEILVTLKNGGSAVTQSFNVGMNVVGKMTNSNGDKVEYSLMFLGNMGTQVTITVTPTSGGQSKGVIVLQ